MQSATGSGIISKCEDEKQIQASCCRFRHSATDSGIFYKVMQSATESCILLQIQAYLLSHGTHVEIASYWMEIQNTVKTLQEDGK